MKKEIASTVAFGVALTGCAPEGDLDIVIPSEDQVVEAPELGRDDMGCLLSSNDETFDSEFTQRLAMQQVELTGVSPEILGYWSIQVDDGCEFIDGVEAKVDRGDWPYSVTVAEALVEESSEFIVVATQSLAPEQPFQIPTRTMTAALVDAYLRSNAEQFVGYELSETDVEFLTNQIAKSPSFDTPFTYQAPGSEGSVIQVATINSEDVGTIMECMADLELSDAQEYCIDTRL